MNDESVPKEDNSIETPTENNESVSETDGDETEVFVWGNGIALDISPDELRVSIEISPAYASYYSPEKLERFLAENNIVCETDHETIDRIFEEYLFNQSLVVAEGVLPQNGEDGRIEWEIDLSILDGAELVEQGGRVDWKEHNYILPVIEEQHLARMIDPTEGTPGVNVHGEAIPANLGKEIKFPAGKGVKISDDGHELISEISGVVCREGTKISVTPVFTVPGDVDFCTGFNGGGKIYDRHVPSPLSSL